MIHGCKTTMETIVMSWQSGRTLHFAEDPLSNKAIKEEYLSALIDLWNEDVSASPGLAKTSALIFDLRL